MSETILDTNALAVDLVESARNGVMDANTHRTTELIIAATEGMTPVELIRLVGQVAWTGGALAALMADEQRVGALARLRNTNGDQP